MSWPLTSDALNARMMEQGSKNLLFAINSVRTGRYHRTRTELMWSSTAGNWERNEESKSFQVTLRQAEYYRKREEDALANLRPRRDPCSYCGVRMDIGCKHTRAFK